MTKKKILLIGEFGLDRFITLKNLRLSPEAASLVGVRDSISENWGMAGNVYNNLLSLSDPKSYELEVVFIKNQTPITKTRFIDEKTKHIIFRLDEHDFVLPAEKIDESALVKIFNENSLKFSEFDAIVISSYNKGLVDKNFLHFIFSLAAQHNIPTFADFKFVLGEWSKPLFCAKINSVEMAEQIKNLTNPANFCKNLIVTQSDKDTLLYSGGKLVEKFPCEKVEVSSQVGAGDTAISALVIKYLETNDLHESIKFANKAAAVKVTKNGVVAVRREEISF
jgi:bifunctional ADP-heptose synthase (sugar kinase/adenylyltransferase)